MRAVKAYYDGKTFVPMQNYAFRPQQKVLIVVDEDGSEETADEILSEIRNNRVQSGHFWR